MYIIRYSAVTLDRFDTILAVEDRWRCCTRE